MISIIRLCNTLDQRAKTGTSGYDSGPEKISKINDSQTQLLNLLIANYGRNQQVNDALAIFVKPITKSTVAGTGLLEMEDDYVYFGSVQSAAGQPAYPINANEVAIIKTSAIRSPNVDKGLIFHYQKDNQQYFLPDNVSIPISHTYIRKPVDAELTFTPVSNDDDDYTVLSGAVDLEWPETMFNMLLYMTMEKLGLEMKEQLLMQYAQLGIQQEQIDLTA